MDRRDICLSRTLSGRRRESDALTVKEITDVTHTERRQITKLSWFILQSQVVYPLMQQIIQKHHSGGSGGRASRQTIRRWINPDLHLSVCQSILRQDTEPRVAPDVTVSFISTARVSNKVDQSALQDKTTDQYNKYSRIKHKTNKYELLLWTKTKTMQHKKPTHMHKKYQCM